MTGRGAIALSLAVLAVSALAVGFSAASFTDTTQNPQTVSAAADFLAPSAGASAVGKSEGGVAGYIRAGGSYRVYAEVADSGNPSSKVSSVNADLSKVTTGQTAVVLSPGSYAFGGVSYNYRSAQLRADSSLGAGAKSYALTLTDGAGNARVQSFSVTATVGPSPAARSPPPTRKANEFGEPEEGDTIAFTYNDVAPISDPSRSKATTPTAAGRSASPIPR